MLFVLSALALGACKKCEDTTVDIGVLSVETIAKDYKQLENGETCVMSDFKILFRLTHLNDGTLGFEYDYACWNEGAGFEGTDEVALPFASSCEDPMWTTVGNRNTSISSVAYESDRHCFEPLLDSEIPKKCDACDDTDVEIGYLKLKDIYEEMTAFYAKCGEKTYLQLQLQKVDSKYGFMYIIDCWDSDGSSFSSEGTPTPLFTANECKDATAWGNNVGTGENISDLTYSTNRYCLQHHVEEAKKKVAAKAKKESESSGLSGGEIAGMVIGIIAGIALIVVGVLAATGKIFCPKWALRAELLQDYM